MGHVRLKRLATAVLDKKLKRPEKILWSRWDKESTICHAEDACLDAFGSSELGRILQASINRKWIMSRIPAQDMARSDTNTRNSVS